MYSLRRKLERNLLLNMLLIMGLLILVMNFVIRGLVNDYVASRLEHDLDSLVSALRRDPDGRWRLDTRLVSPVYQRVRSGHYFVIRTPVEQLRSRSLFDIEPGFSPAPEMDRFEQDGPGKELWLVIHRHIIKQNQPLDLWVVEDIHQLHDRLLLWFGLLVLLMLGATFLLMTLQRRMLNQGFRIFERLRDSLQKRRYQALDIDDSDIPLEILPLLDEIRMLIERLRQRAQRTRNALGDLAHELKRPLQVLSLANEEEGRDPREGAAVAELRRLIDRELKRARISGTEAVGLHFDPHHDLPAMLQIMERIYPGVAFNWQPGDVPGALPLDRDDLLELIGNLLDNAGKFARSCVHLSLSADGDRLRLVIEDDGPGLPEDQAREVLEKGVRLDETREGQGLGLRICADIVDSYRGRLSLERSHLGGLRAEVELPLQGSWPVTGPHVSGSRAGMRPLSR